MPPIDGDRTTSAPAFNPQNPATWLKPDEPLIGADGRDWSWCYVWFKDVPGFPGYRVGFDGSVWTCKVRSTGVCSGRWKPLKQTILKNRGGYLYAHLWRNAKSKAFRTHRLVLKLFWGPCPDGMECLHGDDNPANNRFDNLKWGTVAENARQREERNRGTYGVRHWKARLTPELVREILEYRRSTGAFLDEIARRFHISQTQAGRVLRGESWRREFEQFHANLEREPAAG